MTHGARGGIKLDIKKRTLSSLPHMNHWSDVSCPHPPVAQGDSSPCNFCRILVICGHHDFDQSSLLPFSSAFAAANIVFI